MIEQEIAAKLAKKKSSKVHPMVFQTHASWEMLKGRDVRCLCLTCGKLDQISRRQVVASKILSSIILNWEYELESENQKSKVSEDALLYNKQLKNYISATKIPAAF